MNNPILLGVIAGLLALILLCLLRDMRRHWIEADQARYVAAMRAQRPLHSHLSVQMETDRIRAALQAQMAETERELAALRFFDVSEWLS